jgi:hypothetical protein
MKSSSARLFLSGAIGILALFHVSASGQVFLGPTDSDAASGGMNWLNGACGASTVSIDTSDPAGGGGYALVISNTVAGKENRSDWRSQPFPLGPAAGGARPITFSFAYKLPHKVTWGDNILVQLRFFDATGTNYISQRVVQVGTRTGDSAMDGYKTFTMNRIFAPRNARTADVWIDANIFEPWVSGTAQFANFSVTTAPRSWFFKIGVVTAILSGICILVLLLFYRGRDTKVP